MEGWHHDWAPACRRRNAMRLCAAKMTTAVQQAALNPFMSVRARSATLTHAYTAVLPLAAIQMDQHVNEMELAPF